MNRYQESNQAQIAESINSAPAITDDDPGAGGSKLIIRLAAAPDAMTLALLRYDLRSSRNEVREDGDAFIQRCKVWMQKRLNESGSWKCWIAERNETVLGSVWAQLIEKIPNPVSEPECYIYLTSFFVREEYRNKGIGSLLLSAVLEWSKTKNAQAIILWPRERSKPLYLRQGFSDADDLMQLVINTEESRFR